MSVPGSRWSDIVLSIALLALVGSRILEIPDVIRDLAVNGYPLVGVLLVGGLCTIYLLLGIFSIALLSGHYRRHEEWWEETFRVPFRILGVFLLLVLLWIVWLAYGG